MVHNWKNFYLEYHIHHVTGTVHQWQTVLISSSIIELFYKEYNRLSEHYAISTLGYVILPEHFHLLIWTESGHNIVQFLHGLRRSISGKVRRMIENKDEGLFSYLTENRIDYSLFYFKTARKSEFRFWKEKPRVFPMNHWPDIQKKLEYIHLNPVRRGLVDTIEAWPYSSIRSHLYGEDGNIAIGIWPQDVAEKRFHPEA
jgi:putative transposase